MMYFREWRKFSAQEFCAQLQVIDTRLGAIPRATVEPPIVYSSMSPQPTIQATLQTRMHALLTHVVELQVKITKEWF